MSGPPEATLDAYRKGDGLGALGRAARRAAALLRDERPELLDLDSTPEGVRRQIIADVDRLNGWFHVYSIVLRRLDPILRRARTRHPSRPVRLLDVGTGHGGLLFAIADWARRRRLRVELAGCDIAAPLLDVARRGAAERGLRLELFAGDARRLDEVEDGEFDVALLTLALHHLPPADAARALLELDRVSAETFLVLDLRRSAAVLPFWWLFLRATVWGPTRHDGVRSLRRAYTPDEVRLLAGAAGLAVDVESVGPGLMVVTRGGAKA